MSNFTLEQLQKIKEAYASGVLRVHFGDQIVQYKSEAEMRRIIAKIEAELGKKPVMTRLLVTYGKGL
jgi:hypothetical protein